MEKLKKKFVVMAEGMKVVPDNEAGGSSGDDASEYLRRMEAFGRFREVELPKRVKGSLNDGIRVSKEFEGYAVEWQYYRRKLKSPRKTGADAPSCLTVWHRFGTNKHPMDVIFNSEDKIKVRAMFRARLKYAPRQYSEWVRFFVKMNGRDLWGVKVLS